MRKATARPRCCGPAATAESGGVVATRAWLAKPSIPSRKVNTSFRRTVFEQLIGRVLKVTRAGGHYQLVLVVAAFFRANGRIGSLKHHPSIMSGTSRVGLLPKSPGYFRSRGHTGNSGF